MVVVPGLRIEPRLQLPQALRTGQLHVQHRHQLVAAVEALDVAIASMALHDFVKGALRHRLQYLLKSIYAVHVAAVVGDTVGACGLTAFNSLPQHLHPRARTRPLYELALSFQARAPFKSPSAAPIDFSTGQPRSRVTFTGQQWIKSGMTTDQPMCRPPFTEKSAPVE